MKKFLYLTIVYAIFFSMTACKPHTPSDDPRMQIGPYNMYNLGVSLIEMVQERSLPTDETDSESTKQLINASKIELTALMIEDEGKLMLRVVKRDDGLIDVQYEIVGPDSSDTNTGSENQALDLSASVKICEKVISKIVDTIQNGNVNMHDLNEETEPSESNSFILLSAIDEDGDLYSWIWAVKNNGGSRPIKVIVKDHHVR